jgi:hypothetical protein
MDTEAPDPQPAGQSRRTWLVVGGIAALAVAAVLAFGVFGVHTLFIDDEVSEAGPAFDSGAQAATTDQTLQPEAEPTQPDGEADRSTTTVAPAVATVATGSFTGVDHPGSGTVNLLSDGVQTFVRFEDDFSTDNGPDLYAVVYVDGQRVELGTLKGNRGAQNYELPAVIDPSSITTVAVWCKRFDSTFTEAELS